MLPVLLQLGKYVRTRHSNNWKGAALFDEKVISNLWLQFWRVKVVYIIWKWRLVQTSLPPCFFCSPLYQTRKCWYSSCNHQVPLKGHLCAGFIHLSLWLFKAMSPKYHFVTQKIFVLPSFENVSAIERVSAGLNGCVPWGSFAWTHFFAPFF